MNHSKNYSIMIETYLLFRYYYYYIVSVKHVITAFISMFQGFIKTYSITHLSNEMNTKELERKYSFNR